LTITIREEVVNRAEDVQNTERSAKENDLSAESAMSSIADLMNMSQLTIKNRKSWLESKNIFSFKWKICAEFADRAGLLLSHFSILVAAAGR
jgi:hypothetical protein